MSEIDNAISNATGVHLRVSLLLRLEEVASIRHPRSSRWMADFFLKINQASFLPFFEAEAEALKEIRSTQTIMAPDVITHGVAKDQAF